MEKRVRKICQMPIAISQVSNATRTKNRNYFRATHRSTVLGFFLAVSIRAVIMLKGEGTEVRQS